LAAAAALAVGSCGDNPTGPKPGGAVTGRYLLQLQSAATCASTAGAVSFPVDVTGTGTYPHPGVQLTLDAADPGMLELELKYTEFTLEGGFGTTGEGVLSNEPLRVWINAIGTGQVTQTSDGRGEVLSGSLRGSLEVEGTEPCTATSHSFTLRTR
jgi:hypothetical protein